MPWHPAKKRELFECIIRTSHDFSEEIFMHEKMSRANSSNLSEAFEIEQKNDFPEP